MSKSILVFAAKQVGLEMVEYLLSINAPVKRVIVANAADQKIIDLVKTKEIPIDVYTDHTQEQLVAEGHRYEWLLNLWSPHILCPPVLAQAVHRLNVHPSLVPHCRGNDNAAWTIRKGLPAGVSLLEMCKDIDGGEVYVQKEVQYSFPIRGSELHGRLQKELIALFKKYWPAIYSRQITPQPQKGLVSEHTRKQTEQDRVLDASATMTIEDFLHWILAHDFSPRTTAEVRYLGLTYKIMLTVEEKRDTIQQKWSISR